MFGLVVMVTQWHPSNNKFINNAIEKGILVNKKTTSFVSKEIKEIQKVFQQFAIKGVWAIETKPEKMFDASLEEIWHLITEFGYSNAYPDVFGGKKEQKLLN